MLPDKACQLPDKVAFVMPNAKIISGNMQATSIWTLTDALTAGMSSPHCFKELIGVTWFT